MAKLLTVLETAQFLGCAPTSLVSRRWREQIGLRAVKVGRSVMFLEADLDAFIASRKEQHHARVEQKDSMSTV